MKAQLYPVGFVVLTACAESAPNYNFEPTETPAKQVLAEDGMLSYQFDNDETLTIESNEQAAYVTGQGALATVQSEDAIAYLAYLHDETDPTTEINFARLGPTEMPQIGTAQYRGTFKGALLLPFPNFETGEPSGDPTLFSMADHEITFEIVFEDRTIEGELTTRTVNAFGGPFQWTLDDGLDLYLLPTKIKNDGSFEGVAQYAQPDPEVERREGGSFAGLIAGPEGDELVGEIRTPSDLGIFLASEVEPVLTEPVENE